MGNGMNKVLEGLYVGSYRDSKDTNQIERLGITHIISIHDSPKRFHPNVHYLMIAASDSPDQNVTQYFTPCNDFIHAARLQGGKNVLIHCLAGMSRSVTLAVAYVMTVTDLNWEDALKVIRSGRNIANPNRGFQAQLQDFEMYRLDDERQRLKERFPSLALFSSDREECYLAMNNYEIMLSEKAICEGDCRRGDVCPTGLCRVEQKIALRRRQSQNSNTSLSSIGTKTQSCPASPRSSKYSSNAVASSRQQMHHRQLQENDELMELPRDLMLRSGARVSSAGSRSLHSTSLSRSPSIASTSSSISMNRYNAPRGLFSYTSSAPPSLRSSRIDLATAGSSGSVTSVVNRKISDTNCHSRSSSTSRSNSCSAAKPPPSPKRSMKRFSAT